MVIKKIMFGDEKEAFIEDSFTEKINIIFSDDNQRGKTILVQSIFYCLGISRPVFPKGFDYKKFYYILEIEENGILIEICRHNDTFVVKVNNKLSILESISEFKRFWTRNIFEIPFIIKNERRIIADPDLFFQLSFIGQDNKDTSNICNHSYYKKEDFYNLIYSFMHINLYNSDDSFNVDEAKDEVKKLKNEKRRLIKQHKIILQNDSVVNLISSENYRQQCLKIFEEINNSKNKIIEYRKKYNKLNIKIVKYESLEKELVSLNYNLSVGHFECLDCHSQHIGYSVNKDFSFDVSTTDIRNSILVSIKDKIDSYREELDKLNIMIEKEQNEIKKLLTVDDVSLELLLTVKNDVAEIADVDSCIDDLNVKIQNLEKKISSYDTQSRIDRDSAKNLRKQIVDEMKSAYKKIDKDGIQDFSDIFTPATQVYSGSNIMVFYLIKFYALEKILNHNLPIIIDSFRAEDLSTNKEQEALKLYNSLPNQVIFTTTLKTEELGKYDDVNFVNKIDYSSNMPNKIMTEAFVEKFIEKISEFNILINLTNKKGET